MTAHTLTTDSLRPDRRNPYKLSHFMDFDHVIQVHADGAVTEPAGIYAPELYDSELSDPSWDLMNGYSGQWCYSGPIMHPSEFIGGRMADDILDNPGLYVAVVSYSSDDLADEDEGPDPDGWAVAFRSL